MVIVFGLYVSFCCLYQCKRLPGKSHLRIDLLYVGWDVKPYLLTYSLTHFHKLLLIAVLVKNKIEYRKHLMTLIQATVRMWKVRREYLPRYVRCECSANVLQ